MRTGGLRCRWRRWLCFGQRRQVAGLRAPTILSNANNLEKHVSDQRRVPGPRQARAVGRRQCNSISLAGDDRTIPSNAQRRRARAVVHWGHSHYRIQCAGLTTAGPKAPLRNRLELTTRSCVTTQVRDDGCALIRIQTVAQIHVTAQGTAGGRSALSTVFQPNCGRKANPGAAERCGVWKAY